MDRSAFNCRFFDPVSCSSSISRELLINLPFENGIFNITALQLVIHHLIFSVSGQIIFSIDDFLSDFLERRHSLRDDTMSWLIYPMPWSRVIAGVNSALNGARNASDSNASLEHSVYSATSSRRVPRPALKLLRACSTRRRKRGSFSSL